MKEQMEPKELNEIFDGSQNAVNEMKKVFSKHDGLETVVISPDSWVGLELLRQTKRLINLQREVSNLNASINRLERKLGGLPNNAEK